VPSRVLQVKVLKCYLPNSWGFKLLAQRNLTCLGISHVGVPRDHHASYKSLKGAKGHLGPLHTRKTENGDLVMARILDSHAKAIPWVLGKPFSCSHGSSGGFGSIYPCLKVFQFERK
jgi:hypothetical protein